MINKYINFAHLTAICGIILFVVLFACIINEEPVMVFLDENENAFDFAVNVGNYNNLVKLLSNSPDANVLNQQIGFKYIKESTYGYRTTVKTDTGYVIIYYYQDNKLMGYQSVMLSDQNILEEMIQLEIGTSISEVQSMDPSGNYKFLYSGSSKFPKISFHYFSDGNVFEIYYNDQLEITEIMNYII